MADPFLLSRAAATLLATATLALPALAQGGETEAPAAPQDTQEQKISEETARLLIRVSGIVQTSEEVLAQAEKVFEEMPILPPGFTEKFREEFKGDELDRQLLAMVIEHVEPKAAKSAIEFFQTESGQVWKATLKQIDEVMLEQSQTLGQEIAMAIMSGTDAPPIPEREEVDPASDEAKLQAKLDTVLGLVRQKDFVQISLDLTVDSMKEMPGITDDFVAGMKRELTADRVTAMIWPELVKRVDMELLNDVEKWARTDDGQLFFRNQLALMPEAIAAGQAAGREAGEKAAR